MKRRATKNDMETFVEEPDYSSFIETDGFYNRISKDDEYIVRTLIAVPEDPLDDMGSKMADRLQRDLVANFAVLDKREDFKKWLEQKRTELRQGFGYKLNTDKILTKYDSMIDGLGPTDTNLIKSLPNLIKEGEKVIKDHESNKMLSDAEKRKKIEGVQRKIDNMRGTIRSLIKKGSAKAR